MKAKMIVLAAAAEGQREALDHWYATRHIPDIEAVPGIVATERYDLQLMKAPEGCPQWDFFSVYSMEGDDIPAIMREMGSRMGGPLMPASPTLDSSKTLAFMAFPKGED